MSRSHHSFQPLFAIVLIALAAHSHAADYRGMAPGWPNYPNGVYAANYPASAGAGPAYYVARPVSATTAYYSGGAAQPVAYMPVRAAYSNPTYFAAYGVPASNRAPAAYYAPPQTAYYAPAAPAYAPSYSYSVTPAGSASAGSEASLAYAQPTSLNYVPARVAYRPAYAAVPVYMYRPVNAYYQPAAVQPATCYQPAAYQPPAYQPAPYQPTSCCYQPAPTSRCQSSQHPLSFLNPFTWFRGSGSRGCGYSGCGYTGCGSAPATTAYCCQSTGCGQPYYPTQPVVPVIPAVPAATAPTFTPVPSGTYIPSAQPRVPSPPTRTPGTLAPADLPPRITPAPSGGFTPVPGTGTNPPPTVTPGGSFPIGPSSAAPPFNPGTIPPGTNFPSGSNYPPTTDPYSSTAPTRSTPSSPTTHNSPATSPSTTLRAPELGSPLAPGVSTVPDPDARQKTQPVNRAPQLLDQRDRSAARNGDQRWAVVPAVWPKKQTTSLVSQPTKPASVSVQINPADYDDRGWRSAP